MTYPIEFYSMNPEQKDPLQRDSLRNRCIAEKLYREKRRRRVTLALGSILQRSGSVLYRAGSTLRAGKEMNTYG